MSEETVRVSLGDDYYKGAYFLTDASYPLDYEIPQSQLERWEKAMADYGQMQAEIDEVMEQQRDRVLALMLERRKGQPSTVPPVIQAAYKDAIARMLKQPPLLNREEGS